MSATPVSEFDEDSVFMQQAIEQAKLGRAIAGCAEVGCVIVRDHEVVCGGFNEAERLCDPTAHAEMITIRKLCAQLSTLELSSYTLYCTLQPCGMCTMACLWAGISRIVYGAGRSDVHEKYFASRYFDTTDLIQKAFRSDLEVRAGVLAIECAQFYLAPGVPAPEDPAHGGTEAAF